MCWVSVVKICEKKSIGSFLFIGFSPFFYSFSVIRSSDFGGLDHLCGVKMMSLRHGWGWKPPQIASHIHIRLIQSVWAHWYALHRHTVAALHSYTHTNWVRFRDYGSLLDSKWCHYDMVEADSHLKLHLISILDIYKVFEHIDMLPIGIQ